MKHIIALCTSLLLFSSCSLFGNTPENQNTNTVPSIIQKTGIIRSKNISFETPGTHLLEQLNGETFFLESKVIALSNYLDQNVTVEGLLTSKENHSILDVSAVYLEITNSNTNQSNNLLSYTGSLGISFQYSSLFTIIQSTEKTVLLATVEQAIESTDDASHFTVSISKNPIVVDDIKQYVEKTLKKESVTIQVGNILGERLVSKDTTITIYVSDHKAIYEILFTPSKDVTDITVLKNKFYEMLDSMLWTESEQTNSNMNTNVNNNGNNNTNTNSSSLTNTNKNSAPHYTGEVTITNDTKKLVISYITEVLNDLKPTDENITGSVSATKFEFASPNYVYVEFTDGKNKRKLLLTYTQNNDVIRVSQIGYFIPGIEKDWEIKTGSNDAATLGRELYTPTGNKTAEIEQGMRLYENKTVSYSLQYPASWYYAGTPPTEKGALHQVNFSDKPLDTSDAKISVLVFKGTFSSLGITSSSISTNDSYTMYVEKDGKVFKITGAIEQQTTISKMAQTMSAQ